METILLLGAIGLAIYVSVVRADVARLRDEVDGIQRTLRSLMAALAAERTRGAINTAEPTADAPRRPVVSEPAAGGRPVARAAGVTPSPGGPGDAATAITRDVPPAPRTPPPAAAARQGEGEKPARTPAGAAPARDATLDFETRVGTTWTLRIGLGAIAIAGALFARTIVPHLSNGAKVALAYAGALLLFGVGKVYESKLERFARPVMAGGLSLAFFVSFAAHFVPAMRAIPLVASLAWMTGGVLAVLILATRWGSQPTAGLAIFLGHVSAFVAAGDANGYSLIVIAFLSVAAVALLRRHGWLPLSLFAVAAAYASHLLWSIVAHDTLPAARALLLNLLFLSSYYGIFLAADLLWWRRQASPPEHARASAVGRMLGPSNLVFYVSLVSFLYVMMPGPPRPIEWFYFAVAALQGGLALAYRRLRNPDYGFYVALGTVLLTIGFIAALDQLALNLVLAAEALVLLLAAHRTRLRVFHLLAQAALLVNFLHYWTLGSPPVVSLAVFIGGLAIAAVYFAQSQLEEVWYAQGAGAWRGSAAPVEAVRPLAEGFDALFGLVAPSLPYLHAVAGTVILLHQILAYFPTGFEFGAVGVAFALIGVVSALRGSMPMSLAYLVAQGGIVLLARTAPPASLLGRMGIVAAGLAMPTILAMTAARRGSPAFVERVLGVTQLGIWLAMAVPILFVAPASPAMSVTGQYLLWVGIVSLVVVYADRAAVLWGAGSSSVTDVLTGKAVATATGMIGALLIALITDRVLGRTLAAPVWSSIWTAALVGIAATRRGHTYSAAGLTLLGATYAYFLTWVGLGAAVAASTSASALVIGVPLVIALALDRSSVHGAEDASSGWRDGATYLAYGCASAFLFYVLQERVGQPWAGPLLMALPVGLLLASQALGPSRAVRVAIVMTFVAALYQAIGLAQQRYALWPGLATLLAVVVVERMVEWRERDDPERAERNAVVPLALVVLGGGVAFVALYRSTWPGVAWTTAGWSVLAAAMMGLGFAWRAAHYRRVALAGFTFALVRVFAVDVRGLSSGGQTLAFLVLGVSLVAVAWLYARFSATLRKWL